MDPELKKLLEAAMARADALKYSADYYCVISGFLATCLDCERFTLDELRLVAHTMHKLFLFLEGNADA